MDSFWAIRYSDVPTDGWDGMHWGRERTGGSCEENPSEKIAKDLAIYTHKKSKLQKMPKSYNHTHTNTHSQSISIFFQFVEYALNTIFPFLFDDYFVDFGC
jgi:hypothetical protein